MNLILSRASAAMVGAALLGTLACKQKEASVEELYTTRMLALSYLQRNQLPEAEAEFKKLTDLAPDDPLGYANLGLTYLQGGRYEEAEKQLRRARELDPGNGEVGLALAKLYTVTRRPADARATLEQLRRDSTRNARVLYALAELDAPGTSGATAGGYEARLRAVLAVAPANLVVRMKLANSFVQSGQADSAVQQLEEVRRIPPELPREARVYLDSTIQLLRAGNASQARATFDRLNGLVEVTGPYQASLEDVKLPEGPISGRAILNFSPKGFISIHGTRDRAAIDVAKFTDATSDAGLATESPPSAGTESQTAPTALATGDVDGDGTDDLFVSTATAGKSVARLYRVQGGFVRDVTTSSNISLPQGAAYATFADFDNDGWLDLFVVGGEKRGHLLRNRGDGKFEDVTAKAGVSKVNGARKAIFVDLDHDGDLDLLLIGNGPLTAYRNNLDGTFTESTAALGLAGSSDARDAVFADFDGDGRVDVFIAGGTGADVMLRNGGAQRFSDVTASSGLTGGSAAVTTGDYNNDGFLDLFVSDAKSGQPALWLNKGNGTFARDTRSASALQLLAGNAAATAAFIDYDNDGWLDLIVGAKSSGGGKGANVFMLRNDRTGKFIDKSTVIPLPVRAAGAVAVAVSDVDDDGDQDLWLVDGTGAPRLLRNDMGNSNLAVNVELKGLRNGSGKNNAFGIGARLELRAGDIYQTRIATDRVTHFGLGPHLKADVLRVEWPNGVPQTIYFPGSDQDVVEREMLKG
ncbi:MAG TPA: FG-GAP-like repeat-containing protein, partial [Gemmatimonadaceae bacterium]|nr:FG-GAP-like repeat-containing protein [Gemmatimonadaceae bacterium]